MVCDGLKALNLLECLGEAEEKPFMMSICGGRHVGKTTLAEAYWHELVEHGVACAGFIEKAVLMR